MLLNRKHLGNDHLLEGRRDRSIASTSKPAIVNASASSVIDTDGFTKVRNQFSENFMEYIFPRRGADRERKESAREALCANSAFLFSLLPSRRIGLQYS